MNQPNVTVEKLIIAIGAGHWLKRYVVVQDGLIKELFINREDAEHLMNMIIENWAEKE